MSQRQKAFSRVLAASLTSAIGLLAAPVPASAQVSIVPDQISGGGTQTVAFRLATGRPDTKTTRLELAFPQYPPIAFVQVAPVPGWTATVHPRPLNPAVRVGDRTVSEVAASLVLEGGAVPPGQFEQFLVTLGPLPGDGRLAFEATQSYANGTVDHWTDVPGRPSPVITLGSAAAAAVPASAAGTSQGDAASAPEAQADPAQTATSEFPPLALLWGALGVAAAVIAVVGYRARRRRDLEMPADMDLFDEPVRSDEAGKSAT
jgi:uncharacterized protein YcnI